MSTQWRCAVCEAVNEGGDTCAACGATVTQTVVQAPPAQAPEAAPVPRRPSAPARRRDEDAATEIPVRELPRGRLERDRPDDGPYDIYDLFDLVPVAEADPAYDRYEPVDVDTRPRVRVYGCCLPIALGILLSLLGALTLLGVLIVGAL
jgi:hypothetical protein